MMAFSTSEVKSLVAVLRILPQSFSGRVSVPARYKTHLWHTGHPQGRGKIERFNRRRVKAKIIFEGNYFFPKQSHLGQGLKPF
jgi:hypothetical protein